jgi:hypothetical protein
MIKFFRKIRQKMLTENKFSKYLLYAFGEIILVVIGILIALSINNWNTNRINNNLEKFYIQGIIHDIETDLVNLSTNISLDSQKVISGNYLLNHFKNPTLKKDSIILFHFSRLLPGTYYIQNSIVFEDIKFSGRLNTISNSSLRNNIQRYYSHGLQITDVLKENSRYAREFFGSHVYSEEFDINSILNEFGSSYAKSERMVEVNSFDSQLFYKSSNDPIIKELINRISINILLAQLNVTRLKIGKDYANELTHELKNYLK